MDLDKALTHVAVLGAAGKMGSGIALLLLQEISRLDLEKHNKVGSGEYTLNLIDVNEKAFPQLREYLRNQLYKHAEKNINDLRKSYAHNETLISNAEIIEAYVNGALDLINFDIEITAAKKAHLVFEAIGEDIALKAKTFQTITEQGNKSGFFLTNTSSIPIHILNEKGNLNHRIIGFHFYNPPLIQKLVEIIAPSETNSELVSMAYELAKRLKKTIASSKDIAGFIGNGYMIREIAYGLEKVQELSAEYPLPESIYLVNRVTQDWLIRPMGVFQLIDYVGVDVCQKIFRIMREYLKDDTLKAELIDQMINRGILGGQNPDGTQKNGFFSYEKSMLKGIYSFSKGKYIPFADATWVLRIDRSLGKMPIGHQSWKTMQKDPHRDEKLRTYFEHLQEMNTLGGQLAQGFLQNSRQIANTLMHEGILSSQQDLNTVLVNGFYHLYVPDFVFKEIRE